MTDSIAAVIPTRNRAHLVTRAVESVLAQTHPVDEIIVVVDGPDHATVDALRVFGDTRVRWIVLPKSNGSNHARNVGAARASTQWVAFLDDDDEWLPGKIEAQLAAAGECEIVSCRFARRSRKSELMWPKRLPRARQKFGDYLFERRSIFNGEAAILTSTMMIRKALFDALPFSTTLRRHQDADWVIRATSKGARIVYAPEVLVRFDDELGRVRISTTYNWSESLEWIRSVRELMSRRAYAGFLLTSVGAAASDNRAWGAFLPLLREALAKGNPTLLHLALYLGMWTVPQRARQRLRAAMSWSMQSKRENRVCNESRTQAVQAARQA